MLRLQWCLGFASIGLSPCVLALSGSPLFPPSASLLPEPLTVTQQAETPTPPTVGLLKAELDANPWRQDLWLNYARALYNAKQYRNAITAFRTALERQSTYTWAYHYDIGCCHALLGEKEDALRALQTALDLGWRNLTHMRDDEDLVSLRDDPRFKAMVVEADLTAVSRDEGFRFDLALLARELKRGHYAPFALRSESQFDVEVKSLHDAIPGLRDEQILCRFAMLAASMGDGHTHLGAPQEPTVPLQFYRFEEGLFVTLAAPSLKDLAGAQVLAFDDVPTETVLEKVRPMISRDNEFWCLLIGPNFVRYPGLLRGLDITKRREGYELSVRLADGTLRKVAVEGGRNTPGPDWVHCRDAADPAPLYLKDRGKPYWREYLPQQKTLYWQYNAVQSTSEKSLAQFAKETFEFIEQNDVERLVLDMRWNGGGNNFLNRPIVHGLIRCDKINKPDRLFVIIGRNTFSAAQNGIAEIERNVPVTFVGEPSGSAPNFVGESAIRLTLPYSKMTGSISDLYWQSGTAMDFRKWIAPKLYAPPTFALYRANRDPALEAIWAHVAKAAGPSGG